MARKPKNTKPVEEVEIVEQKAPGLFDFVNSVLQNKRDLIKSFPDEDTAWKNYSQYMINTALSQHVDAVMDANQMNGVRITDRQHYDYLLQNIRAMKRPFSWAKKSKTEDLDIVIEYYQVRADRAKEYLKILTPDDLNTLKQRMNKGGRV